MHSFPLFFVVVRACWPPLITARRVLRRQWHTQCSLQPTQWGTAAAVEALSRAQAGDGAPPAAAQFGGARRRNPHPHLHHAVHMAAHWLALAPRDSDLGTEHCVRWKVHVDARRCCRHGSSGKCQRMHTAQCAWHRGRAPPCEACTSVRPNPRPGPAPQRAGAAGAGSVSAADTRSGHRGEAAAGMSGGMRPDASQHRPCLPGLPTIGSITRCSPAWTGASRSTGASTICVPVCGAIILRMLRC